jgi:hypothetical protein
MAFLGEANGNKEHRKPTQRPCQTSWENRRPNRVHQDAKHAFPLQPHGGKSPGLLLKQKGFACQPWLLFLNGPVGIDIFIPQILYPLVNKAFANWKMAIQLVDLPIKHGSFIFP